MTAASGTFEARGLRLVPSVAPPTRDQVEQLGATHWASPPPRVSNTLLALAFLATLLGAHLLVLAASG
ncbi:MAG: hypothetical protein JNL82_29870 [Myxococcales bacterium]|nr:hypothetical protein [Myxococcales bacterium]